MKPWYLSILIAVLSLTALTAYTQQAAWPKTVSMDDGRVIKVYEPQPESLSGNLLKAKAAVSVLEPGKTDPVFGLIWGDFTLAGQGSQESLTSLSITNIKFPGEADDTKLMQLQTALESSMPRQNISFSMDQLAAQLNASKKESQIAGDLGTKPPKIIYAKKSSILVLVDGEPDLQQNPDWGVEQVVNTPFTIVKNNDGRFYLYGAKKWYSATNVKGPWNYVSQVPSNLSKMEAAVREADTSRATASTNTISDIIVSTEPAELIQSNGEANFAPLEGTNLLYMTNTLNNIFMDINSQTYYVLVSGRWYKAPALNSTWNYTPATALPADFAKIPEGSPKDVVLSSVAGTNAASESVLDAQIPQTAKVDRKSAKATVTYDGDPKFEDIEGTNLQYAVNTPGSVIRDNRKYYYVENGVWFESYDPNGPWTVSTQRPDQVQYIPPTYPVYNLKYVYIYDATPDFVYMGYTPGYLGTYIYGPTVVYGTGYYYRPWRGRYYYPRPLTWGFNMQYNPWFGWSFGVGFGAGWFNLDFGNYYGRGFRGGWWGPPVYRPPYSRPYSSFYGRNVVVNNYVIRNNRINNVYRYRRDVVTHDRPVYDYRNRLSRPGPGNFERNDRAVGRPSGSIANDRRYNQSNRFPGNRQTPTDRIGDRTQNGNNSDRQYNPGTRFPGNQQRPIDRSGSQQPVTGDRQYNPGNRLPGNQQRPVDRSGGQQPVTGDRQYNPGNRFPADRQRSGERPTTQGPVGVPADRQYAPATRFGGNRQGEVTTGGGSNGFPQRERPAFQGGRVNNGGGQGGGRAPGVENSRPAEQRQAREAGGREHGGGSQGQHSEGGGGRRER